MRHHQSKRYLYQGVPERAERKKNKNYLNICFIQGTPYMVISRYFCGSLEEQEGVK